jgi:DNA-binding IclR family transcriptional regulator
MENELDGVGDGSLHTLTRALTILEELAKAPTSRGFSHSELAVSLGFTRSTLYRYLHRLQERSLVEPIEGTPNYRLGPGILALAAGAIRQRSFARIAKQFVDEVAEETGETAHATIYHRGEAVTVEITGGDSHIAPRIQLGSRRPAHSSASGKVFLAHLPEGQVDAYIARGLPAQTSRTIIDGDILRGDLENVRKYGFATDLAEFVEGVCCVAVPVFNGTGRVEGALSLSIASREIDLVRLRRLSVPLRRASSRLSLELGAR